MAHRIISQVVFTGVRVFGRAFAEAYKQASASQPTANQHHLPFPQKFAAANSSNPTAANTHSSAGLTLDEACRILNVSPPKGGQGNLDLVHERFKRLFDLNDPKKGGSFYLQSKVLRARERIEMEVRKAAQAAEEEEELRGGWRPRVYRD
ncbi:Mitochondrial import inner membrane translocase subunit tim16 [Friedmanniomyces simplex]|uniref:Mitochondrial import inner membrane translocase subunit TIM16 n=1 Tax=Friedmanniomyces simplex TaxID=329884 RepID=A0A4U0X7T0_9PEZI|nr:Mitochondrial import inner membrane translocase subunit tim16 [Friedmanniomyces simplex]